MSQYFFQYDNDLITTTENTSCSVERRLAQLVQILKKKNMAVVAPPGAVATALGTVPYWKQAGSASDTRPHRAVPVDGAHRARSLTCTLTAGPAQRKALAIRHCTPTTTRRRLRVGGVPTNAYLNPPRPPDRRWRSPSGSAVATGRTDDPPFCCQTSSSGPYGGGDLFERTRDYPRLLPVDRLHICSQGNAFLIF